MKRLLTVLVILAIAATSFGQEIFQFKADGFCFAEDVNSKWSGWQDCNLVVTYNAEQEIITINNAFEDRFILTGEGDWEKGKKDEDGDLYNCLISKAVDRNGAELTVKVNLWVEYNCVHFYFFYDNCKYVYECSVVN